MKYLESSLLEGSRNRCTSQRKFGFNDKVGVTISCCTLRWNWRLYLFAAQIHVCKSLPYWFGRSIASSWATHFASTKSFDFNQTGLRAKSKSNDFNHPLPCVLPSALATPVDIIILISSPFLRLSGSSFFLSFQINFNY